MGKSYTQLTQHIVSRGYIVVFSPYQTLSSDIDKRYNTLWNGFDLAVKKFGSEMDLSKVGFVGHSFGGGATPAMAYNGLVNNHWGQSSSFMLMFAPWYSFQITPQKLQQFPSNTVLVDQVYDKDTINDHRMAIDIYRNISLPDNQKHFQMIHSIETKGCDITADHATPNNNPSLLLKQYAVFKTFDAVADYVFNNNPKGNQIISESSPKIVSIESNPQPTIPQENYKWPWDNGKNPRSSLENW